MEGDGERPVIKSVREGAAWRIKACYDYFRPSRGRGKMGDDATILENTAALVSITQEGNLTLVIKDYLSNFLSGRTREAYQSDFKDFGQSSQKHLVLFPTHATSLRPTSSRTGIFCVRSIPRPVSTERCRLSRRFLRTPGRAPHRNQPRRRRQATAIDSQTPAAWFLR